MKQMFVITASGGQYDDAWERAEFVTDDEDKGKEYCEKMNALAESVRSADVQLANWQEHYMKQNPRVGPTPYTVMDVPKWKGGEKITQEMRDERKRIERINETNHQASTKPMFEYTQTLYAAREAYKSTLPGDIQRGMENRYHDTFWEINPINWLE